MRVDEVIRVFLLVPSRRSIHPPEKLYLDSHKRAADGCEVLCVQLVPNKWVCALGGEVGGKVAPLVTAPFSARGV